MCVCSLVLQIIGIYCPFMYSHSFNSHCLEEFVSVHVQKFWVKLSVYLSLFSSKQTMNIIFIINQTFKNSEIILLHKDE